MLEINWEMVEKIGIAGVSLCALYFCYKMVLLFIQQWKISTEAINRNTEGFQKLTEVFEMQARKEREFQRETLAVIYEHRELSRQTNDIVHALHRHLIGENYSTYIKGEKSNEYHTETNTY